MVHSDLAVAFLGCHQLVPLALRQVGGWWLWFYICFFIFAINRQTNIDHRDSDHFILLVLAWSFPLMIFQHQPAIVPAFLEYFQSHGRCSRQFRRKPVQSISYWQMCPDVFSLLLEISAATSVVTFLRSVALHDVVHKRSQRVSDRRRAGPRSAWPADDSLVKPKCASVQKESRRMSWGQQNHPVRRNRRGE